MIAAGEGSELWRVRVDLFAEDETPRHVARIHEALQLELTNGGEALGPTGSGADQGIGVEGGPVVGLVFWVRADDVGEAARTALETARRAGAESGVGSELYDVVVIPQAAVLMPDATEAYPRMPD